MLPPLTGSILSCVVSLCCQKPLMSSFTSFRWICRFLTGPSTLRYRGTCSSRPCGKVSCFGKVYYQNTYICNHAHLPPPPHTYTHTHTHTHILTCPWKASPSVIWLTSTPAICASNTSTSWSLDLPWASSDQRSAPPSIYPPQRSHWGLCER